MLTKNGFLRGETPYISVCCFLLPFIQKKRTWVVDTPSHDSRLTKKNQTTPSVSGSPASSSVHIPHWGCALPQYTNSLAFQNQNHRCTIWKNLYISSNSLSYTQEWNWHKLGCILKYHGYYMILLPNDVTPVSSCVCLFLFPCLFGSQHFPLRKVRVGPGFFEPELSSFCLGPMARCVFFFEPFVQPVSCNKNDWTKTNSLQSLDTSILFNHWWQQKSIASLFGNQKWGHLSQLAAKRALHPHSEIRKVSPTFEENNLRDLFKLDKIDITLFLLKVESNLIRRVVQYKVPL